jgi:hypothetical protein
MGVQIESMLGEQQASQGLQHGPSVLAPIIAFVCLSPIMATCGLMLSQILGFVPY